MNNHNWHSFSWEQVVEEFSSDAENGLSEKEVLNRQKESGLNALPQEKPLSRLRIFFEQLRSPLIYILIIAGAITLILREYADSLIIFSAVFLNTIAGFIQENKASRTLKALKKVVRQTALIQRERNQTIIDSKDLVPGDIVILNAGNKVPADGRIIESHSLRINEMALTGEWLAAKKISKILVKETPLAERDNMVYMGTIVEEGKGKMIVTETGQSTEIGKIAKILKETKEEKTPYQKKIAHFSKIVGLVIGLICFGIFIEGILTGGQILEMFIVAVAVAVAAIPEGLVIALTVILAIGTQRILKKKGLVRKLVSVETLGSASIICTDKTATLTEGKMKVGKIIGDKSLVLKIAFLTSDEWSIRGRATEKALFEAGLEAGFDKTLHQGKISEIPFNSINKFVAALYKEKNENILYVSGAPEKIFALSKLGNKEKAEWEEQLEKLTGRGLRVVATAYKTNLTNEINNLIFAGLIALEDPVRPEVKEAMEICRQAGLKPIIVTGDHRLTAKTIAQEVGFKINEEDILEGEDLDKLSDREFEKVLSKIQIYARVEPRHKLRIIKAWQDRGEVVAMTGDGINDALALKQANIGVALGSGSEVAKETADLILLNDSFSIIVAAVEEGRAIIDNMRKAITYLLSDSFTELFLIGGSLLVSWLSGRPWFLPITAAQILWTNLVEDGLPHIALAFEPKEKDLMRQKPAGIKIPLLTREMKVIIFIVGLITDLMLLGALFWLLGQNYETAYLRTIIFAMLGMDSISYVFCCKSLRRNLWQINIFDNKILIAAWFFGLASLLAAVYLPALNQLLGTVPLAFSTWGIVFASVVIEIVLIEFAKWCFIIKRAKL